jgi:hypothetical protein
LRELKAKEKKKSEVEIAYIAEVKSSNISNPYLLLLANSFDFNFSFLILPDVISNNTPMPFL